MGTSFDQYVQPNDDGSYTVYGNRGEVVVTTRDRSYAARLANKLSRSR